MHVPVNELRKGTVVWYSDPWNEGYFRFDTAEPKKDGSGGWSVTFKRDDGTYFACTVPADRHFSVRSARREAS